MKARVARVVLLKAGTDDSLARWVVDGGHQSADIAAQVLQALPKPTRTLRTELELDDGHEIHLPFKEFAHILPDRTGVLVIFQPGRYTHPDGSDVFPCPNNAAIYNADGSLRCQVHFASGPARSAQYIIDRPFTRTITHKTLPIGRVGEPIAPPIVQFGVLVGTKQHPPESFYVLNTETGELTNGLFSVPY